MEKKWMNNLRKIITPLIIFLVIILALYIINSNIKETPESVAKCIAKRTDLYTQLGCHACKIQEEMFGENYQYLNTIDCYYESDKCIEKGITATPTWIINGKTYLGVQSLELLKNLTGC